MTTALHGAGGFGKTTLAISLCHDREIRNVFDDGILWVTLGEAPSVLAKLTDLCNALTREPSAFGDPEAAAFRLSSLLHEKQCLVVLDDVWQRSDVAHFLRAATGCTRLITTRQLEVAVEAKSVTVDEMTTAQSVEMLIAWIEPPPPKLQPYEVLAKRLGEWPLMLELAAANLRELVTLGESLDGALTYVNEALDQLGVAALDRAGSRERNEAIGNTIQLSLKRLPAEDRERYFELGIFQEDTEIPLNTLKSLWDLSEFATRALVLRLTKLSLLKFDATKGTVRLHDVMLAYLTQGLPDSAILHRRLLSAWGDPCHLPDAYAWRWFTYHLQQGEGKAALRRPLLDFHWVQSKLDAMDVNALLADFERGDQDPDIRQVRLAVQLSLQVLLQDKTQLSGQLLGRLSNVSPDVQAMLEQARRWRGATWVRPLIATLTPPNDQVPHYSRVALGSGCVAITANGRRAVSWSEKGTVKVWDAGAGKEICAFVDRAEWVKQAAITPDGRFAFSVGYDHTLTVWDLELGRKKRAITGWPRFTAVAVSPDGKRLVVGGADGEVQVLDRETITVLRTFRHAEEVEAVSVDGVAFTGDGQAISLSKYYTLKLWDLENQAELLSIRAPWYEDDAWAEMENSEEVYYAYHLAVSPDGAVAVSARDRSIVVWDLKKGGRISSFTIPAREGRGLSINGLALTANATHVVAICCDREVSVWSLKSRSHVATFTVEAPLSDCAAAENPPIIVARDNTDRVHFLSLEGIT